MDEIKHGDLTIEQIADIQKSILVSLRSRETFWDKFCSHTTIAKGMSSAKWRKLNVKELKPSEISNLVEGVTPPALSLEYVEFSVAPVDFGSHIDYTDKSKFYNFDDVVRDAKVVLGQRSFEEAEIRKAAQFIAGTCTMDLSSGTDAFLKDLLKAKTILRKNHVKPINGTMFGCILTPEQSADVLLKYKDSITHTSKKEAIINGYLGELGGFILFENSDPIMYKEAVEAVACVAELTEDVALDATKVYYTRASSAAGAGKLNDGTYAYTKVTAPDVEDIGSYYEVSVIGSDASDAAGYCLFIGKTDYGMPVQTVNFGNSSVEVYNNELGKSISVDAEGNVVADSLHQHGSVGYKCMGFATRILFDEAIIRSEFALADGPVGMEILDQERTGFVNKESSPVSE